MESHDGIVLLDPLFLAVSPSFPSWRERTQTMGSAKPTRRESEQASGRLKERAIECVTDRTTSNRPTDRLTRASGGRSASPLPKKREGGPNPRMIERGRERSLTRAVYLIRTQSSQCHDAIFFLKSLRVQCSWKMGMTGRTRPHSRKWLHSTQKFVGNER